MWLGLPHWYVSTGCLHGTAEGHHYCRSNTGLSGVKQPGTCKHCSTFCRCRCHRRQPTPQPATEGPMLALSRLENEQIRIGPDITITILSIRGRLVRVGIDAPRHIQIDRPEMDGRTRPAPVLRPAAPEPGDGGA